MFERALWGLLFFLAWPHQALEIVSRTSYVRWRVDVDSDIWNCLQTQISRSQDSRVLSVGVWLHVNRCSHPFFSTLMTMTGIFLDMELLWHQKPFRRETASVFMHYRPKPASVDFQQCLLFVTLPWFTCWEEILDRPAILLLFLLKKYI